MNTTLNIIARLHRAQQIAEALFEEAVGDLDVTARQIQILSAIAELGGRSQTEIVIETDIDRSTLSEVCRRLKIKGLITRRRTKHDQRAYALVLTDQGRDLLKRSEKALSRIERDMRQRIAGLDQLRIVEPVREAAE